MTEFQDKMEEIAANSEQKLRGWIFYKESYLHDFVYLIKPRRELEECLRRGNDYLWQMENGGGPYVPFFYND